MSFMRNTSRCALRGIRAVRPQPVRCTFPVRSTLPRHGAAFQPIRIGWATFSSTPRKLEAESEINAELTQKLSRELALEKDMRDPEELPEHLKEFIQSSQFEIQDVHGSEEVLLTRTDGDEKISVRFSVDDLNNAEDDADQFQDEALGDEFDGDLPSDAQSGGATTKGAINQGKTAGGNFKVAPEDSLEEEDVPDQDALEPGFPAHLLVTVERGGKGALQFEAVAQDGLIAIDSVYYYKDANLVEPKSTADERAAAQTYTGPQFSNLDEDLQVLFEQYLSERGVNTALALFVPDYIDFKEQREYMKWLSDVKSFVE